MEDEYKLTKEEFLEVANLTYDKAQQTPVDLANAIREATLIAQEEKRKKIDEQKAHEEAERMAGIQAEAKAIVEGAPQSAADEIGISALDTVISSEPASTSQSSLESKKDDAITFEDAWDFALTGSVDLMEPFEKDIYDIVKGKKYELGIQQFLTEAKNGMLTPGRIVWLKKNFNKAIGSLGDDVVDKLKKINNIARARYYAYYAYVPEESLNDVLSTTVRYYKQLRYEGNMNHQKLDVNHGWTNEMATYTLAQEVAIISNPNYDEVSRIGLGNRYGITDYENMPFQPLAYDLTYTVAKDRISPMGNNYYWNKRIFEEAQNMVTDEITKLSAMSLEEFRAYKLGLLKLQPGEREVYEEILVQAKKKKQEKEEAKKTDDGQGRIGK